MKITFYRSILGPRCALAGLALRKLQREMPDLEIETVETTIHPLKSWKTGIRMIPAIKYGNQVLSGIILSKLAISSFIEKNRTNS